MNTKPKSTLIGAALCCIIAVGCVGEESKSESSVVCEDPANEATVKGRTLLIKPRPQEVEGLYIIHYGDEPPERANVGTDKSFVPMTFYHVYTQQGVYETTISFAAGPGYNMGDQSSCLVTID